MSDEEAMRLALKEAHCAAERGEVPVGAVLLYRDDRIAPIRAGNRVEERKSVLAHAELLVLAEAAKRTGDWRMEEAVLYVTKEPCAMCAGAIVNARVGVVVFGFADARTGGCGSALDITGHKAMLWHPEVRSGVLGEECRTMFLDFFRRMRKEKS
ncbi:MAG: nucleoside deaminase [Victivallaceae bacterium]|nr:nucleoside deaminase [Victivallaceae bacterium]